MTMKDLQHPFFDEVYYNRILNSTTKKAEHMIRTESAQGNFLVICEEQTAAIGRKNNYWFSPLGGLWFTAAIYGLPVSSGLTLFTGICVHKAIIEHLEQDLQYKGKIMLKLKWPNDVYLNERKLGGILSQYLDSFKYHVIGIGINTNNTELPEMIEKTAVSLKADFDLDINNKKLVSRIFDRFSQDFPQFLENDLDIAYFNKFSLLTDREILIDTEFEEFKGTVAGVNKKGALLLKMDSGMIQPFYSGTITKF